MGIEGHETGGFKVFTPPLPPWGELKPGIDQVATNCFFKALAGIRNRETGLPIHTDKSLQNIFRITPKEVIKMRKELGVPYYYHPQLPGKNPPVEAERAFFTGLSLGFLHISKLNLLDAEYILLETESHDQNRRRLLLDTIGRWGATTPWQQDTKQLKMYFDPMMFGFLLQDPKKAVSKQYLSAKKRFGPFFLGVLSGRITSSDRISLPGGMLENVYLSYEMLFGSKMGRIDYRTGKTERRKSARSGAIVISDMSKVLENILSVREIGNMEFKSVLFNWNTL